MEKEKTIQLVEITKDKKIVEQRTFDGEYALEKSNEFVANYMKNHLEKEMDSIWENEQLTISNTQLKSFAKFTNEFIVKDYHEFAENILSGYLEYEIKLGRGIL